MSNQQYDDALNTFQLLMQKFFIPRLKINKDKKYSKRIQVFLKHLRKSNEALFAHILKFNASLKIESPLTLEQIKRHSENIAVFLLENEKSLDGGNKRNLPMELNHGENLVSPWVNLTDPQYVTQLYENWELHIKRGAPLQDVFDDYFLPRTEFFKCMSILDRHLIGESNLSGFRYFLNRLAESSVGPEREIRIVTCKSKDDEVVDILDTIEEELISQNWKISGTYKIAVISDQDFIDQETHPLYLYVDKFLYQFDSRLGGLFSPDKSTMKSENKAVVFRSSSFKINYIDPTRNSRNIGLSHSHMYEKWYNAADYETREGRFGLAQS